MASFKTHLTFGIALGIFCVFALTTLALVDAEWSLVILIFLAACIGAIMPDMDSDTSIPFHITFGSLSLISGGLTLLYMLKNVPNDFLMVGAYSLGVMFTIWVVIGTIFKKLTVHRGMAHSIPAAALSGLIIFSIASRTNYDSWGAFLLGLSLFLGYILHLILDEICAAVNFNGIKFIPNKALGSALKFFSNSAVVNTFVYVALFFLFMSNGQILYIFIVKLIQSIQ